MIAWFCYLILKFKDSSHGSASITPTYKSLYKNSLKPQENQQFSKISGIFFEVDLTGVEPVSKNQSPVLLRVYPMF